jgi:hypothetical protein
MRVQRRRNLLWGIVLLGIGIVAVLRAFGALPEGIFDLMVRTWPALLVLVGLSAFLSERIPYGSLVALIVSIGLVGGMAAVSFNNRASEERSDYKETIAQPVGANISLLRLRVQTLGTEVEFGRALSGRNASGQFVGSTESKIKADYTEAGDGTATLSIIESRPNQFPLLRALGRGRLRLELPADLPLDMEFKGADGGASLNLSGLALERLNVDLQKGDVLITLPVYKPLGSPDTATLGALAVRNGNITVYVPTGVAGRFTLERGGGPQPQYDPAVYNFLVGDILESRLFDTASIKLRYNVAAPRGQITVAAAPQ